MGNRQERIEQCKADIAKLQASLVELQKTETLIKFGDIITCNYGIRIALYDADGNLVAVTEEGKRVGNIPPIYPDYYKSTGINVFNLYRQETI